MSNIRQFDMDTLDRIFDMASGYVLDFSDRTFAQFFAEMNIDICDDAYYKFGTSKAKRLRCFLQTVDKSTAIRVLHALWEYREAVRQRFGNEEKLKNAHGLLLQIIDRMGGPPASTTPAPNNVANISAINFSAINVELRDLSKCEPQPRGYAFERFLKSLFDTFGLEAREAFRLRGEQIDGSFVLANELYLLEAKWHNALIGNEHLHAFHGKVEQKMAWTRGLFISYSGFTEDGLHAFGRGKRIICMDGLDMSEMLTRQIPLGDVLERKIRRAGETGSAFVRVRDLFPG